MRESILPAAVPAEPEWNTTDLLLHRLAESPDAPLFALPTADGGWQDLSTREFHERVTRLAKGLIAVGVTPGDRIALLCHTRFEWSLIDFAAWFAGALVIPVYETSSPQQIRHILEDSGATRFIVESAEHFLRFDEIRDEVPQVGHVWQLHLGDLDKISARADEVDDATLEAARATATEADVATIIYTSGSTGVPKGCVITHANFVELSRNAGVAMAQMLEGGASTLLFVTIAHVFARFISVLCVYSGVKVGHQADTSQLVPTLGSFRPTFLLVVPRVLEKVYNSAQQKAEAGGRGKIFHAAADTAVAYSEALDAGRVPFGLRVRFALFDRLVYSKLREVMGGRVAWAVSGSAPLGARLGHFFRSVGVTVLEGYGLTETTAPATVNVPARSKIGTVGPALPGNGIRIADDGEIEVSGVCVFGGYGNMPEATAEAFDGEWFRTGDLGELDSEGYLTITGRKKELIITAGGKNVAPAGLEDPIRANPIVGQVVVVGDQRPFIGALVTLDDEMLPVWLNNAGLDASMSLAEAAENSQVVAEVQRAVDAANTRVSRAESIRKFRILPTQWTIESGHLTPKLSIKRQVIVQDFAKEIDGLYAKDDATQGVSLAQ